MPHYYTDHNKFYNPFAMFAYAATHTPNTFPTFDLYDKEFSSCRWDKEPEQSFETLMEMRASQLRLKYDKLIMYFSGGTDSATMYRIFKKLRIHIDEIIILYDDNDSVGYPVSNVKWLQKNHYDPTTKITIADGHVMPKFYSTLANDFLTDPLYIHIPNYFGGSKSFRADRNGGVILADTQCGHLFGGEKPHIVFTGGRWYARHLDKIYSLFLGDGVTEMFYVSPDLPELHIKQNHILKNMVKKNFKLFDGWSNLVNFDRDTDLGYTMHSNWCGRDSDITPGASFSQKIFLKDNPINARQLLTTQVNKIFRDPQLHKYLSGFMEIQTDTTIESYMRRMGLIENEMSIDQYYGIWSKSYCLGE